MNCKILAVSSILLFTGCVSVDGLEVDKSFTYQELGNRGLMIAAVVKGSEVKLEGVSKHQLKNLLEAEIRDERSDFSLKPAEPTYSDTKIVNEFAKNLSLSEKTLASLPSSRRYLAYGIIVNDEMDYKDSEQKDSDGKITGYQYITERKITTTFKVYDLEKKKMVWAGDINKRLSETKTYTPSRHRELSNMDESVNTVNAIGGLAKAITGGKAEDGKVLNNVKFHPKPPKQKKVIQKLFEDFADSLPSKGMFD
ncbi:hypothetical protein [Pseudobacteriovorax antillogorgiicola]|uniref:Lipoprotein n=1 Tax=Pseudobacteriovorax antillogorgiicola TaxID=1513793 RepID=A0A1Y6CM29_9BACT|nr:hypothetical protein [Pseudobacteriovorax antillogorgiicola]TCS47246.1 hypothetical protein EDD56_12119 [Pseudobacteriovorax antillogorgiicola]SMF62017.1 hypothetical protein SAMN06296036_12120 [Pseudobacteriovorax antillogorgiicola]